MRHSSASLNRLLNLLFDGLLDGSFHEWILCEISSKRWQLFDNVMAALDSYA